MRKLIFFNFMTLDGFFEGPKQEINWHIVDEEFNEFAIEQLDSASTLLFGRVTYQLMAGYWTSSEALKDDTAVAKRMNSNPKFVFSKTLRSVDWENTTLVQDNAEITIHKLKQSPGKDLLILGSASLAASFRDNCLIDEYRIMINPVILGKGNPLFKQSERLNLKLLGTKTFSCGNVLMFYSPNQGKPLKSGNN